MTSRRSNRHSMDEETLEALKAEHETKRMRTLSAGREEKDDGLLRTSSTTSSSVSSDMSSTTDCGMEIPDLMNVVPIAQKKHSNEPDNFALVIPGVYRSSYPQMEHHEFLKDLGLKTIITLVSKEFPAGFEAFMQENGIRHVLINVEATKKANIPDSTLLAILSVALDTANYPLLIHCNHGKHRTGCVVAAVRHWQEWPCERIIEEYKQFAAPKARPCDLDYIANFNVASLAALTVAARGRSASISDVAKGLGGSGNGRLNQKSLRLFLLVVALLVIWTLTIACWQK